MSEHIAERNVIDLNKRCEIILKQPIFSKLSPQEAQQLSELLIEVQFSAGDTIVQEADPINCIYFIVNGNADVKKMANLDGKLIATLEPGNNIGLSDTGFYSVTGRRTATVIAKTDILLLKLKLSLFHGFALVNRHVSEILRQYSDNLLKTQSK